MEIPMSDATGPSQLVPASFEEIPDAPDEQGAAWSAGQSGADSTPTHEFEAVFDVPVRVHAVLGRSRMEIGELMRVKAGDVVELDRRVGEPVDMFVNNRLIARGEVVLVDNALGVTLTEIVRQDR